MDRKEQIKQAKRLIATGISKDLVEVLEKQFPELAESEDERIRKGLVKMISNIDGGHPFENYGIIKKEALAYLEKQKEQILSPLFKVGDRIKLKSEPKYPFREIIDIKDGAYYFDTAVHLPFKEQDKWEAEQKQAEWSEEDEHRFELLIAMCEDAQNESSFNSTNYREMQETKCWLKNRLKYLRSPWKPSKEQINALEDAKMRMSLEGYGLCPLLQTLINDLRSL